MYNLLTPLARVRLSKHYTTKTTTMLFVIVLPISRSCQSMVYRSMVLLTLFMFGQSVL